ncbi:MAG: nucleotide-binding universal stress UspA family protein [Natronomonas sp.]|jgi:nucleotide-binding universal stress UspA family protein|uniref:universal stress protein n=1 Tax=Natronomonas sp. TaxID=2184060 RepID=UPI003988C025
MYHVVIGIDSEDENLTEKIETVTDLPAAAESVRVTLVHVHDGDGAVESVGAVADALSMLAEANVEATAHGVSGDDATQCLIEAAETLDADLLCIGGRQRSPAGKRRLKRGASEIILRADCPVVIAGALESREPRT